ncbi:hypothetical protein [Lentzea flava]|uniref:Uncharacterized protein n=1 Tax=Lentzea flava TaxID=103732 RepID=A0ABQ2V1R9_9PSEU|nr:hypothetical protein [Lentzea flava]MCP2202967.1 hypothetical protein [Lentzea flava]GGU64367.1 hypothetical protein GCM10010178_65400 [Lentzea flava]
MSIWEKLSVQEKVRAALGTVTIVNESGHHFGRPYMTAYQLAIKVDQAHPEIAKELKVEVGGTGKGYSLAQYLANQLSQRIKNGGDGYEIEGAFLSNDDVCRLTYTGPDGEPFDSSLTSTGFDISMFRLRHP